MGSDYATAIMPPNVSKATCTDGSVPGRDCLFGIAGTGFDMWDLDEHNLSFPKIVLYILG
jgi:hypothetical protein